MDSHAEGPPVPLSPADRLDSWKAIARHLRRDVRTVQRWQLHGLPVYRLQHHKHGSVYAYRSEIDLWWTSRQPRVQERLEPVVDSKIVRLKLRYLRPGLYTALGFLIALFGFMLPRQLFSWNTEPAVPPLKRSLRVLVFPFEEPSQSPQDAGLARDFEQNLIRNLGFQQGLSLVSSSGIGPVSSIPLNLPQIASKLHADVFLSGTIVRERDELCIGAQLIDARSGKMLWKTQFEEDASDAKAFASGVAHAVALEVENALSVEGK